VSLPLLIVNPRSGIRGAGGDLPHVLKRVEEMLGDVAIRYTAERGHARDLALEGAREGHSLIIAVGGDGTFSEVANGVLAYSGETAPSLGIIDLGTGGDFRRSLGIGEGLEKCLEALSSGDSRLIDVGRASFRDREGQIETHHFINVLSAGLGGLVDRYIERMPSFIGGKVGYYLAALGAVARSKERALQARITWNGTTRDVVIPAYVVAVCNGRWFGGGMDVAPMALPDDGRFEVITITAPSKPYLADRVRSIYTGRHLLEPTVHHFPCTAIELSLVDPSAERRFLLDVDGEALGSLPLRVELLRERLKVRA
jgi:YegS/Rv2252/BmrU family lipid kinase